ncbi:MAG TPA: DUF2479 domain-containing protein [Methylophaga sp.]|nr:DUF2479 domain-containing protein [Methylophaga sp.]
MGISDFYRGDTQRFTLVFTDNNKNPIDITGATVWFTLKSDISADDSEAEIQKVVTNHIDPANGITEVVLSADDTSALIPNRNYYYDFQIKLSTGDVKTLLAGKVKVLEDVTRSY